MSAKLIQPEMKPVSSPAIKSIGYDKEHEILYVEFHESGLYRYHDVPPKVYDALMSDRHHARYYDEHIKTKYRGEKLD
ncbi:hypothetical protein MmiHf6_04430 [Methanimicrococcus hongohii]|uniref:KTSC domain-containing protein n=1 Tax=Methanimicrococcus hongohii TaxID=3028295 RepID=A0AA96UZD6_9EURY|nr:KTSC domain-containing protein [Methanimicrococcus sp. Hf6]WNY23140.1 hypothetical protein MmiHf6_04430 [Methanimicrococcus sp. Hf6]